MGNRSIEEDILDYTDGTLAPAEKERVERAIAEDPSLQSLLDEYREVRGLERIMGAEEVPQFPGFEHRVREKVQEASRPLLARFFEHLFVYRQFAAGMAVAGLAIVMLRPIVQHEQRERRSDRSKTTRVDVSPSSSSETNAKHTSSAGSGTHFGGAPLEDPFRYEDGGIPLPVGEDGPQAFSRGKDDVEGFPPSGENSIEAALSSGKESLAPYYGSPIALAYDVHQAPGSSKVTVVVGITGRGPVTSVRDLVLKLYPNPKVASGIGRLDTRRIEKLDGDGGVVLLQRNRLEGEEFALTAFEMTLSGVPEKEEPVVTLSLAYVDNSGQERSRRDHWIRGRAIVSSATATTKAMEIALELAKKGAVNDAQAAPHTGSTPAKPPSSGPVTDW